MSNQSLSQENRRKEGRIASSLPVTILELISESSDEKRGTFKLHRATSCDFSPHGLSFRLPYPISENCIMWRIDGPEDEVGFTEAKVVNSRKKEDECWQYGASFIKPMLEVQE